MDTELRQNSKEPVITLTDNAQKHVAQIFLNDETAKGKCLRVAVVGGGCSGMSYKIDYSNPTPKDFTQDFQGFTVVVDPKSALYLKGVTLDYQAGLNGKGFVFSNPNASGTCGCGESFSV